eukprot:g4605.t1
MENPVTVLNDLCIKRKLNADFNFERIETLSLTRCVLTVSAQKNEPTTKIPSRRFEGNGKNKKEAKRCCSSIALDALSLEDEPTKPRQSLGQTILDAFTSECLWKDPCFHAYLAMEIKGNWVPVRILSVSKFVTACCQEQDSRIGVREMAALAIQELQDCPLDEICLSPDTQWISIPSAQTVKEYKIPEIKEQEILKAVLLPVDEKAPPVEVQLESSIGLVENITALLGTEIQNLSLVQNVSTKSSFTFEIPNPEETEFTVELTDDVFSSAVLEKRLKSVEVRSPSLWSNDENQTQNQRASWLSSQSVYGDAVLTLTRPSRDAKSTQLCHVSFPCHLANSMVLKWRSFDLASFWSLVESKLPNGLYSSCLVRRLPCVFQTPSEWHGQLPSTVLAMYLKGTSRELDSSSSEYSTSVQVKLKILDTRLEVMDCHEDQQIANERASLQLLKLIHVEDSELWNLTTLPSLDEVQVIDPGQKRQPLVEWNHRVRIEYRLFCQLNETNWYLMESQDRCIVDVHEDEFLHKTVLGLRINGVTKVHFPLCINGSIVKSYLFVRVMGFVGEIPMGVKLFPKPAAELRVETVGDTLTLHDCQQVLDIGCGEGRLLLHLLTQHPSQFSSMIGVDISSKTLSKAQTSLSQIKDASSMKLSLFEGNIVDCGEFVTDAVTMIEVIEHLDADPLSLVGKQQLYIIILSLVGSVILGGIKPRVFIATTPNWEYNVLIHAVTGSIDIGVYGRDGTPLRCSDHRFEWTRDEFQNWALELGESYGYSVSFEGIGVLMLEDEVRVETGTVGKDLGQASQMAVFIRQSSAHIDENNSIEIPNLKKIWCNY